MGTVVLLPAHPCPYCHKNEATQLCDFVVDYIWTSHPDHFGLQYLTCDNSMCKECATNVAGHEFCPDCAKLYEHIRGQS